MRFTSALRKASRTCGRSRPSSYTPGVCPHFCCHARLVRFPRPSSNLAPRPRPCSACIVCDDDATSELRVKTVRYFKGIQETQVRLSSVRVAHVDHAPHMDLPLARKSCCTAQWTGTRGRATSGLPKGPGAQASLPRLSQARSPP